MYDQLEARLGQLKAEFEAGQKALAELEANVTELKGTLSRISGAIQVLEEEIDKERARPFVEVRVTSPASEIDLWISIISVLFA